MGFRKYNFEILIRLLLMIATVAALIWFLPRRGYLVVQLNLIALVILQGYLFFRFITKWQRDLSFFANAVKHDDYSISYRMIETTDPYYALYEMLNSVSQYARRVKAEYIQQSQYFQYVVENTQVGLIAYESNGAVLLVNRELLRITGLSTIKNLSDLRNFDGAFYQSITSLSLNTAKLIELSGTAARLSARLSKFVIDGKDIYLLSLLNINSELQENELRSWQDLISVLTHEIMNSISPIHSLNESMVKYLDKIEGNDEIVAKAKNNLDVINRRSQSLMSFVTRYRSVSNVPLPQFSMVDVPDVVSSVLSLLDNELKDIEVHVDLGASRIYADLAQFEQILINLLRNARQSMLDSPQKVLTIRSTERDNITEISITDTGLGIAPEIMDKIFIPFFTTKKEGSGIGLTLARQIMQKHGGTIDVVSNAKTGSTFRLVFRNKS